MVNSSKPRFSISQDMLNTIQVLVGGFSVGDLFPSFEWISLVTGMKWRLDRTFKRFNVFIDELIAEHLVPDGATSKSKDFVQILLESQKKNECSDLCLTMDNIKSIITVCLFDFFTQVCSLHQFSLFNGLSSKKVIITKIRIKNDLIKLIWID